MKISLDALQTLDAIDRCGSFAAAAQLLHRVPSALTHAVKKLEADLGFALFARSGRKAALTPAGQTLLADGRALLRAAGELECRARRVATGWETELRIGIDALISPERLFPLLEAFYAEARGTEVRMSYEILGGGWDALLTGRADLVIGAPGDMPSGGGLAAVALESVEFAFAIAPGHPLAALPEPLPAAEIMRYRAIVLADTSRELAARSSGLLAGQEVLAVPDAATKVAAQVAGLGVGYLSRPIAEREAAAGRLVIRRVAEPRLPVTLHLAWRSEHRGKALQWFVERLRPPGV